MLPCWADVAISIRCLRSLTLVCYTNRHESHSQASRILTDFMPYVVPPQRQAPPKRFGQFKLTVGQYPIKNHLLGIALPDLYLKRPRTLYQRLFFFFKQVNFSTRPVHPQTLLSRRENSRLTTRCRSRSTGSGAELTLGLTVSDKQSSKLRLVIISRLDRNRKHPNFSAQAEPPPNSSQLPIFPDLFCPQRAPWLSYPGRSPVQTQGRGP